MFGYENNTTEIRVGIIVDFGDEYEYDIEFVHYKLNELIDDVDDIDTMELFDEMCFNDVFEHINGIPCYIDSIEFDY